MEFFLTQGNLTLEPLNYFDGKYHGLSEIMNNPAELHRLYLILLNNEKSRNILKKMENHGIINPANQVKQFIICNFSVLDATEDITETGSINPEYTHCGHKGANHHCPFFTPGDPKPFCIKKFKFQSL